MNVVLIMGVAGSGKTTLGKLLAEKTGWELIDADDYHSVNSKQKMARGIALMDDDRLPWLKRLRDAAENNIANNKKTLLACSALKESYRQQLIYDGIVYLKGSFEEIRSRLSGRAGHFFDERLLQSQFDILEEPKECLCLDVRLIPEALADKTMKAFRIKETKRKIP